jgi:ABC-type dipeptide/oligopeptide/nickel transport system permease subunit
MHEENKENPIHEKELKRFFRVMFTRKIVGFGAIVILLFIFTAIFAPLIAPYDPDDPNPAQKLSQPSAEHLLGTDSLGRDTLSRLIFGARTSLIIGLCVIVSSSIVGMILGLVAAYFGRWVNTIIMRFIDALMSFPMIILAMVIASLLGGGMRNVIIALSIGLLPSYARLMYGQVLSIKENDYILAARAMSVSNLRIMAYHIVLNSMPPMIVLMSMMLGATILGEAGLSFLGIGINPPTAVWGSMINDGRKYLLTLPVLSFAPGIAIMLVVFAFNMVGDGLRDALDPRLRGTM